MTTLRRLLKSIADSVSIWIERKTAQAINLVPMGTDSLPARPCSYTLQVKVKKCREPFYWYQRHIGETFVVVYQDADSWWVREPDEFGFLNFILKVDAEIV